MKKLLSMLVVLAMAVCIFPAFSFENAAAEAEPTTVTISTTWQCPDYFSETVENKALLEKENIYLKAVYANTEKLGVMLAGGDLTDIVIGEYPFLTSIISNGMAKNLDPLLDDYIPNLKLDLYKTCNEILRLQMSGGTGNLLFCVPGQGVEYAGSNDKNIRGYIVRWDLYKELGLPEIKSDDDYVKILGDMLALTDGVTEDGKTMYGMGLAGTTLSSWYSRGWYTAESHTRMAFADYLFVGDMWDGSLVNGYENLDRSPFWVDMRFYNKLYRAGLFDPDSFTMTSSELTEKVKAGTYMATTSRNNNLYNTKVQTDPDTLEGYVMIPSTAAVMHADYLTPCGFAPTDYYFISSKTDNWEAAAKVLNFYHDPDTQRMIYSGVQGVHWDYNEEGVPTLTEEMVNLASTLGYGTDAFVEATGGVWGGYWELTPFTNTGTHPDGYFFDLFNEQVNRKNSLTHLDADYAQTFGFDTPSAYHCSLIDAPGSEYTTLVGEHAMLATMGITDIPLDIQRILTNCNDILFNSIADFVMAEDDAEFNALVEDCLRELAEAGEAEAWEWCSAEFDKNFEVIHPIFMEYQAEYLAHPAGRP